MVSYKFVRFDEEKYMIFIDISTSWSSEILSKAA